MIASILGAPPAALHLDGLGAGLGQEAARVVDGQLWRRIRQERHVAHDQRRLGTTDDRLGVMEHVLHRDRDLVLVAEHHPTERIADEGGMPASSSSLAVG